MDHYFITFSIFADCNTVNFTDGGGSVLLEVEGTFRKRENLIVCDH